MNGELGAATVAQLGVDEVVESRDNLRRVRLDLGRTPPVRNVPVDNHDDSNNKGHSAAAGLDSFTNSSPYNRVARSLETAATALATSASGARLSPKPPAKR
eukprot:TRINITY_DN33462_c0_g1_i2.p2 TRINITY_DN33462_c0_g1~~TRINITY_DN33462_c0_g1_i2.p2  ORF type:complete len:101 (+),score=15.94 TRINITY_DN33462_c0_g1_i2:116-418(+)